MQDRLLLWDIDGTLINSGRAGIFALKRASAQRFGEKEEFDGIEIAGRTDSGIVRQLFAKHQIPMTDDELKSFLESYLAFLKEELPARNGRVLPGVRTLLEHTAAQPRTINALLTGNIARGAELKLEHYGLWKFFSFGAFADDHHDRNELGAFAHARALEKTGQKFAPQFVDVIGDTGHDIACGKAIGARTIAVATGSWSRARLAEHGPDFLFDDLSRCEEAIARLDW